MEIEPIDQKLNKSPMKVIFDEIDSHEHKKVKKRKSLTKMPVNNSLYNANIEKSDSQILGVEKQATKCCGHNSPSDDDTESVKSSSIVDYVPEELTTKAIMKAAANDSFLVGSDFLESQDYD